jgi:hypothetical protein
LAAFQPAPDEKGLQGQEGRPFREFCTLRDKLFSFMTLQNSGAALSKLVMLGLFRDFDFETAFATHSTPAMDSF